MTRLRRLLCRVLGHQDEPCEWTAAPRMSQRFVRMATVQMPPVESGKLRLGMVFSYG